MATVITPRDTIKQKIFEDNENHVLEIGCGNGEFLLHLHEARENHIIWGLDISNFALKKALSRTKNIPNILLVKSEGKWFLQWIVPENSIKEIYLLFPDPWPGREKRRIVDKYFLNLLGSRLKPHGKFFFSTDSEDYFEQVKTLFIKSETFEIGDGIRSFYTKYERKWKAAGRKTYTLSAIKSGNHPRNLNLKTFLNFPQKINISKDTLYSLSGLELKTEDTFFKIIKTFRKQSDILYKTIFRFKSTGQKQLFIVKNNWIDILPVQSEIYPEPLVEIIKLIFS